MFILAISPGRGLEPEAWARVLESGVDGFLVREPQLGARDLLAAARWVRERAPAVELWLGGRLDLALAAGSGLHAGEGHPPVPAHLLPLSRPLHAPEQIADRAGARQLLLSPVFPVPGKGPALGAAGLHRMLDALPPGPRALALGGISPDNLAGLGHPRLGGVALLRGLWPAPDPAALVARLRAGWGGGRG